MSATPQVADPQFAEFGFPQVEGPQIVELSFPQVAGLQDVSSTNCGSSVTWKIALLGFRMYQFHGQIQMRLSLIALRTDILRSLDVGDLVEVNNRGMGVHGDQSLTIHTLNDYVPFQWFSHKHEATNKSKYSIILTTQN